MLQVYFKYTWIGPENILGPYLEKYELSTYLTRTSPSTLQEFFSKYVSSIPIVFVKKLTSSCLTQVFFKESYNVLIEDPRSILEEVFFKRTWPSTL